MVTCYPQYFVMALVCGLQSIRIIIWKDGYLSKSSDALFQEDSRRLHARGISCQGVARFISHSTRCSDQTTCDLYLLYVRTGTIRHQKEKSSNQIPVARSQHLFFKSPKIFRRRRFYIGDPKIGRPGGAPRKHPFFCQGE
jgi:hypothetical protein